MGSEPPGITTASGIPPRYRIQLGRRARTCVHEIFNLNKLSYHDDGM